MSRKKKKMPKRASVEDEGDKRLMSNLASRAWDAISFGHQEEDFLQAMEGSKQSKEDFLQAMKKSKQSKEDFLQAMEELNQAHLQAQKALARTIIAPGVHRYVNGENAAVAENEQGEVAQTILNNVRRLIDRTTPEELLKQFASLIDGDSEIDDGESEYLLSLELKNLKLLYSRRQKLLEDTITSTQVAELLGWNSRKTVHDRLKAKDIIGIKDKSHLRFPLWQFDPDGDNGVLDGLPELLSALEISNFRKLSWLTKPLRTFEDKTPVEILKQGDRQEIEELIVEAEGVGVLQ